MDNIMPVIVIVPKVVIGTKNIMCWAKISNWTSFMQTAKALSILHICISFEPKPHVLVQMSIFVLFKRAEKSMVSLHICLV